MLDAQDVLRDQAGVGSMGHAEYDMDEADDAWLEAYNAKVGASPWLVQQPACMRTARAHCAHQWASHLQLALCVLTLLSAGAAMQAEAEGGARPRLSEDMFEAAMSALELAHFEALNSRSAEWQPDGGWA